MKKFRRGISVLLTLCLMFTMIPSAFAQTSNSRIVKDDSFFLKALQRNFNDSSAEILEVIEDKGIKDIKVKYSNGIVAQIKEKRVDNKIHLDITEGTLNNKLIIDMESKSVILDGEYVEVISAQESIKENATDIGTQSVSWTYSDTPLFGSSVDYTRYLSTTYHNVNLGQAIEGITMSAFWTIISVVLGMGTGVAMGIMGLGFSAFYTWFYYYDPKAFSVYMKETQYYHKTLNFYRKHYLQYYKSDSYSISDEIDSSIIYSGWAGL